MQLSLCLKFIQGMNENHVLESAFNNWIQKNRGVGCTVTLGAAK